MRTPIRMPTRTLLAAAVLSFAAGTLVGTGIAQAAACKVEAANKKLAGAAQASFMKKCEADAVATCEADSAAKKLAGAAKNSFIKKCVNDAVGK
jgi:hypothetical protein